MPDENYYKRMKGSIAEMNKAIAQHRNRGIISVSVMQRRIHDTRSLAEGRDGSQNKKREKINGSQQMEKDRITSQKRARPQAARMERRRSSLLEEQINAIKEEAAAQENRNPIPSNESKISSETNENLVENPAEQEVSLNPIEESSNQMKGDSSEEVGEPTTTLKEPNEEDQGNVEDAQKEEPLKEIEKEQEDQEGSEQLSIKEIGDDQELKEFEDVEKTLRESETAKEEDMEVVERQHKELGDFFEEDFEDLPDLPSLPVNTSIEDFVSNYDSFIYAPPGTGFSSSQEFVYDSRSRSLHWILICFIYFYY